jgi:Carboxypeptidase regulatory-like domain
MKVATGNWFLRFLVIVLCALGLATISHAQSFSGVSGVVFDPSKGVVPDASVALTNAATGFSASTTTNSSGQYEFLQVPPAAAYTLTFTKVNFRSLKIENVDLGVGVTETRDASLELGETKQTVEVVLEGQGSLNTTDASIGNVITNRQVEDLPIEIRTNAARLLALQPGVQADDNANDDQYGSVTGARADQQNITLDGLDVVDETIGQAFTTVGRAPVDSVQEVRTIVGNGDSSYGRSSSAQVDIVTKSGTNDFHGSISEYNRNTDFEANNYFNNLNGVGRAPLVRNQFGGNIGGPIKKDKLFFFFDYEGLRLSNPQQVIQPVPVDAVRNGGLNYINDGPGCTSSSRIDTQPACISTLSTAQLAALDPQHIGPNAGLLALFNSRYPEPNDISAGDGVNTQGFLFNAPFTEKENTFVGRVDFNLTSKQKLFGRATWDRDNNTESVAQFPGDPPLINLINHDRSWVIGHTWTINNSMVNNIFVGLTRSVLFFPSNFAPTAPTLFEFGSNTDLANPYGNFSSQGRNVEVPEVREQFTWAKGRHTLEFGADVKPIREYSLLANSINFPIIGLGNSNITQLNDALRPADLLQEQAAINQYDGYFPAVLGRFAQTSSNFNYDVSGNPETVGTPVVRHYAYNEVELYAQDTFRVRSDLSVVYGLRWQYHAVPYEQNGFESVASIDEQQLFNARVAAAAAGTNGNAAAPLTSFVLGGPKNNGPGYYNPDYKDFAPRLGISYSPSFKDGLRGKLFGDRQTVIRAGSGLVYDRVLNTLTFELDQSSFLFSNNVPQLFGTAGDPVTSLATDPRFTSLSSPPLVTATPISRPFTPNVDSMGNPVGLEDGGFPNFFSFNRNLRTPYSVTLSFGVQRQLPGNFILEADYFGRFGRRLTAIGDAAQTLNFKDVMSGQFLNTAFGNVQKQVQSGVSPGAVAPQPWFENQLGNQLANFGLDCPTTASEFFGLTANNCTQLAAQLASSFFPVGDVSSTILTLAQTGVIAPNTGLYAQTGSSGYIGNFGSSNYNGLLLSLRKRLSQNLTFDFNYAFAHSIDNVSEINNNFVNFTFNGAGLVCDLRSGRTCRANSDFDARHTISANYVYTLPVGRGQRFLRNAPAWADLFVGGWGTSGIITWHSGYPFSASSNTFPINFTQSAPAVFVGPESAIQGHIHQTSDGQVQFFADQNAANAAFAYPFGGGTGTRNAIRGPNYSNVDMGLFKNFTTPWSERQHFQFRADAFNIFNNVSFAAPGNGFNTGNFGVITQQENNPRVLQVALKFEF